MTTIALFVVGGIGLGAILGLVSLMRKGAG